VLVAGTVPVLGTVVPPGTVVPGGGVVGVVVLGVELTHHQIPRMTRMTTIIPITQPQVLLLLSMRFLLCKH
jgi:hypothetical protein